MSQPPIYSPQTSFITYQAQQAWFPGQQLDVEFNALKTSTTAIEQNLALIQKDDGTLGNGVVGWDQLSPDFQLQLRAQNFQGAPVSGPNTWLGVQTFPNGIAGYMNATPILSAIPQAFQFIQDLPAATLGVAANWNTFAIVDSYIYSGNLTGWEFVFDMNTGAGGDRSAVNVTLNITGTTSNPAGHNEVIALSAYTLVSGLNAGGLQLFAFNPGLVVGPGTTGVNAVVAQEIDVSVAPGVSMQWIAGLSVVMISQVGQSGTARGTAHTAGLLFSAQPSTSGFDKLILIGNWNGAGQSPFGPAGATGGWVMTTVANPSFKFGIDFTGVIPVGDDATGFPFLAPGFTVDWGANITCGNITSSANIAVGPASFISWTNRSALASPSDGVITASNHAGGGFTLLQLGGTTSSFPSIKRNGAAINFRLADDSADASITAGGITAGATSLLAWSGRAVLQSPADGNILLSNNAQADFGLLQLGGSTNAFPAIKRNSAGIRLRLADDSADAALTLATVSVGANQVVGARATGWTVATGTPQRTTFTTSGVTLAQLAGVVMALEQDLIAHGLIGT